MGVYERSRGFQGFLGAFLEVLVGFRGIPGIFHKCSIEFLESRTFQMFSEASQVVSRCLRDSVFLVDFRNFPGLFLGGFLGAS